MRVILACKSFRPNYGGPAYSVTGLAQALASVGVEVGLWAPDGSTITTTALSKMAAVLQLAGPIDETLRRFGRPDLIHDSGLWAYHNHSLARLSLRHSIPRIVSVRGMLEPWAREHKRLKKDLAWWLYQRRDLERSRRIHATAEAEAINIRALGLGPPVLVIPNGVDLPREMSAPEERKLESSRCRAVFLGRFHPVKGLPMLIEAWARVRPKYWELQLAGYDERGHRAEVERAVRAAGLEGEISLQGPLTDKAKETFLRAGHLFVLPTHSENFGMAIAEALAHGLPVLTTRGAPWPMLPEHNCGWWVEASVEGLAEGLRCATALSPHELHAMGMNGKQLILAKFSWARIAERFVATYQDCIATGS